MSASRQDVLLAAIQRKPTSVPSTPATKPAQAKEAPAAAAVTGKSAAEPRPTAGSSPTAELRPTAKPPRGKPIQFWLHEEDRRIVRELSAWLAGQGIRPTDSMVVRAALRMVRTGGDLLEAYRQAALLDGRLRPNRNDKAS